MMASPSFVFGGGIFVVWYVVPFLCCNRVSKRNYSDFVPIWIFWRLANSWCTTINYVNRCNEYLGLTEIISEIILELILDAHWLLMKARWNLNADTELDACPPKARWNLDTNTTWCLPTKSKMKLKHLMLDYLLILDACWLVARWDLATVLLAGLT